MQASIDLTIDKKNKSLSDILHPTKLINKSKHEVYIGEAENLEGTYAMKLFPHTNGTINLAYLGEKSLLGLKHPNIVCIQSATDLRFIKNGD